MRAIIAYKRHHHPLLRLNPSFPLPAPSVMYYSLQQRKLLWSWPFLPLDNQLPKGQAKICFCLPTGSHTELADTQILLNGTEIHLHSPVHIFSCLSVNIEGSNSQSMVPKLVSSTSSGNCLEMQIIGPTPESETLWTGPSNLYSNKLLGCPDEHASLWITTLEGRRGQGLRQFARLCAWLLCLIYMKVCSPRVPLHAPVFSITCKQLGLWLRAVHPQPPELKELERQGLSFPCLWVNLPTLASS